MLTRDAVRVAGAYAVLLGGVACLCVEKGTEGPVALRPLDGTWEDAAVGALTGLVTSGRMRRLRVERDDGELEPVPGFVPSSEGLVRYGA